MSRAASTRARSLVLDNEAGQALLDPTHRKHRRALAAVEVVASRTARRAGSMRLLVPTAVRVEAGWDRRVAGAAATNRIRAGDVPLDPPAADRAAAVRNVLGVSVADAHLAVAAEDAPRPVAVLTSDEPDVRRIAAHLDLLITVVAL